MTAPADPAWTRDPLAAPVDALAATR